MARGSKTVRQRDDISVPSEELLADPLADVIAPLPGPAHPARVVMPDPLDWIELDDQRHFHPLGDARPAVRAPGRRAAMSYDRGWLFSGPSEHVVVCARRKVRREVLHALRRTRGGGAGRRRRRSRFSNVRC